MMHEDLVERAVMWLLGSGKCTVAFSEFATSAGEIPDAIGFQSRRSKLIECKVSRADFAADRHKLHRKVPSLAMGGQRYFMVPAGLIETVELPPKWGLLYVHARHVKIIRESEGFPDRSYGREIAFLVSMLRRAEIRAINKHHAAGNDTRPSDFLNQWIKSGSEQTQVR